MTIKVQISDAVYASLLKGRARVQGTIALVSPMEGNFNAHHRERSHATRIYRKLPHGRVSLNNKNLRLTLSVDLDEQGIRPAQVLIDEGRTAGHYAQSLHVEEPIKTTENEFWNKQQHKKSGGAGVHP